MTRVEFLTELDHRLSALSKEQADEHLNYYAEMLADRMEDGMSEEEAVASMERVDVIARRILGTAYTTPAKKNSEGKWLVITALAIAAVAAVAITALVSLSVPFGSSVHTETVEIDEAVTIPDIEYVDEQYVYVETDGIRMIDVSWVSGYVYFEVWDEAKIGIIEYGAENMICATENGTLKIECGTNDTGDLTICLPRVFAQRDLEEIRIHVTSADVSIYDINANTLILSTVSGYLDVIGYYDMVSVTTTSGDVNLSGSWEEIKIESISGAVFLDCDSRLRTLEAHTTSADLSIMLSGDFGFDLEFSSVSGVLSSGMYGLFIEEGTYSHGNGEAALYIETVSGNVFIE